jgi:hypothetical protein
MTQRTLTPSKRSLAPEVHLAGIPLQKAIWTYLQTRARTTAEELKGRFSEQSAEELADTLKILKRMGKITVVEEDGIIAFVGAKCELCRSMNGTCVKRLLPPKHGWACKQFMRRAQEVKNKDTREQPDEFDKDAWLEKMLGR